MKSLRKPTYIYLVVMSTVTEIKAAIDRLTPQKRCEVEALLHPWTEDDWDRQTAQDAEQGGMLHDLMSASRKNAENGKLMDFPPSGSR